MTYVLVYISKDKQKKTVELSTINELGRFVYDNHPIQIIVVRVETT